MFDTVLKPILTNNSPRILQWADLYMKSFYPKQVYADIKASHTIYRTNGIRHLLLILKESRHFYVPGYSESAKQFEVTVESLARSVSRTFDPTQSGITNRDFFIKSPSSFTEILFLSNLVNPLSRLPANIGYYSGWRQIRPLRMVEMSDMPLSFNVDNQTLNYRFAPSGFGVFALDPAALILKYESFRREFSRPEDTEDSSMLRYLVRDVIEPCLLNDSFALWMRNLYRNILSEQNPDYPYLDSYWPTETTQIVGAGYQNFLREVGQIKDGLINKTLYADRVLNSLPVSSDNIPIAIWMKELQSNVTLPNQYQYQWVSGMMWFTWIETIWLTMRLGGKSSRYRDFIRILWHPLRQWGQTHPWTIVKDPFIQTYIRTRAEGMLALLEKDLAEM